MGAEKTRHASRLLSMAIPPGEKEPSLVAPIDAQILARMEKIDQVPCFAIAWSVFALNFASGTMRPPFCSIR
jgi:hypothetical protein